MQKLSKLQNSDMPTFESEKEESKNRCAEGAEGGGVSSKW